MPTFKNLSDGFNKLVRNLFHVQEDRHEANSLLDALIYATVDPIFVKDGNFRWVMLNDAYCRFVGKPREALIGYTDFELFPRKEATLFRQKDVDVLNTGRENAYESNDGKVNVTP